MVRTAASLEMNINTPPTHYPCLGQAGRARSRAGAEQFRRDGQFRPGHGGDDTDADQRDDAVEGELAPPATMIDVRRWPSRAEPVAVEAIEPVLPPPAPDPPPL